MTFTDVPHHVLVDFVWVIIATKLLLEVSISWVDLSNLIQVG